MKRVLICLILLMFSSIICAQEKDEIVPFDFLGKMPVNQIDSMPSFNITDFEVKDNELNAFLLYLFSDFMANSTFNNEGWNQSDYTRMFLKNSLDQNNQFKYGSNSSK